MIVQLAPGRGDYMKAGKRGIFILKVGEKKDLPADIAIAGIRDGVLVKSGYPEIQNNQDVSVRYDGMSVRITPMRRREESHGSN